MLSPYCRCNGEEGVHSDFPLIVVDGASSVRAKVADGRARNRTRTQVKREKVMAKWLGRYVVRKLRRLGEFTEGEGRR